MSGERILIVDDDAHIREVISYALQREGFSIAEASDGAQAAELIGREEFALVILDVLMPELDGLALCRRIRERSSLPIVFVSSRAEEPDRIIGLELGGDDYLTKPFSPRELVVRVRTVLRRASRAQPEEAASSGPIQHGALTVDPERYEVSVAEESVPMTVTEFELLHVILRAAGRVLTRDDLIEKAYAHENHITVRTIDSHIKRIRAKLRRFGVSPIETVHGRGYRAASS